MLILFAAAGLATVLLGLLILRPRRKRTDNPDTTRKSQPDSGERKPSRSILPMSTVERSIASGAPPTPWMLRREDRAAMEAIQAYFARALPNPVPGGRPYIEESLGHGGPQLELKVPIISSRRSVAVIFRSWDTARSVLESNLYFAGTVNDRLAGITTSAGFDLRAFSDGQSTVYRSRRGAERQQSA